MRLAIFGGTFDPIHNAHLAVARTAAAACQLDRVWFVPAERPPHKAGGTCASFEDRFHMVCLACRDEPGFEGSRIEQGTLSSYSIDTIEKVRARLDSADQLFFLIGADAFADIRTWHRWLDVIHTVEFIVVSRPGHHFAVPEGARVHRLEDVALSVSSSEIRQRLAAGDNNVAVPAPVLSYILSQGLYHNC